MDSSIGNVVKSIGWGRKATAAEEAEVARKRTKAQELLKAIKEMALREKEKKDKEGKEQCDLWFGIRDLQHTTEYTMSQIIVDWSQGWDVTSIRLDLGYRD
ncbi:pro-apoptotic serine protease nma111 [Aspergillus lentulus]|uniref:Pro-apoptotic serine protease nma111 n=1 Tax=Aspergillus lentulus TaxID=293939 RepID=A0ABQ1B168_ASPLE|nr:pro-apoptotic serine protease nma111 [Aspergillus lentulus]